MQLLGRWHSYKQSVVAWEDVLGSDQSDKAGWWTSPWWTMWSLGVWVGWGGRGWAGSGGGTPPSLSPGKREVGTPGGKLGSCFHRISMRLNAWLPSVPYSVLPGREILHDSPFKKIAPLPPPAAELTSLPSIFWPLQRSPIFTWHPSSPIVLLTFCLSICSISVSHNPPKKL